MLKSKLLIAAFLGTLGMGAIIPTTAWAQDRDDRARQEQRFYDRGNRDYRAWNSDEDRRYREYLRHRRYREFSRQSQRWREYWRWRHDRDGRW